MGIFAKLWNRLSAFLIDYVVDPIKGIELLDVLDILLLAGLLYALHCFLRNRRAGRVLFGLAAIVLASVLVTLFKLPALTYIVRLFAASAFFCIVVIFQPEFRDALERLGTSSLLNPGKNRVKHKHYDNVKTAVEETVDAVGKMSESRTGALIVFEGLTKLGDYIHTGKIVDARITSHMLRNIFYDKAPLHDGALIIRDLRIWAASCVLPSAQEKLDFASVGTRHRAAVGLSEVSDALVIVVSEETGIVSVAQDGKLLRDVDRKTLSDILMTFIAGKTYLRFKRANLRNDYRELLDRASDKAVKEKKQATRFNAPAQESKKPPVEEAAPEATEESENPARTEKQSPAFEDDGVDKDFFDPTATL